MRHGPNRLALLLVSGLCACAGPKNNPSANEPPTLKSLASKAVKVAPDPGIQANEDKTIAAYRKFLDVAPKAPQRPEAMRRLGDLEMDSADNRLANGPGASATPDYRTAIARYQDYLKTYPKDPGNDRVIYQLARAYEQGGDLETALKTLDRLVREYPQTSFRDEAQFRRGELLFSMRDYPQAERAFASVISNDEASPFSERSTYMHGWSLFKQGRLDEALRSFFKVLDLKIAGRPRNDDDEGGLDALPGMSRADR